jgi:hypothetical protein
MGRAAMLVIAGNPVAKRLAADLGDRWECHARFGKLLEALEDPGEASARLFYRDLAATKRCDRFAPRFEPVREAALAGVPDHEPPADARRRLTLAAPQLIDPVRAECSRVQRALAWLFS